MFSNLETFVFYGIILFLCCFLSIIGEKTGKKGFIRFAYVILFLVSALRYDIGNDYENFFYDVSKQLQFGLIENYNKNFDVGSIMVSIMTSIVPNVKCGPFIIIALYSFFFLFFVYKAIDRINAHTIGIFLLFVLLFIFKYWDWIKQGVATAIFLYSILFIVQKKPKKFLAWVLFASLWHISALVTLIVYPISLIRLSSKKLASILVVCLVLVEVGLFRGFYNVVLSSVPYYKEVYELSKYAEMDNFIFSGTKTFIITSLWFIFLLFFFFFKRVLKGKSQSIVLVQTYSNIVFVGALIYMISSGALLLDRISYYFLIAQLILVPLVLRSFNSKDIIKRGIISLMLVFHFVLYSYLIFNEEGLNGSNKYESVFSDNCGNHRFRYRSYEFLND